MNNDDPAVLRMLLDEARLERGAMVGRAKRLAAELVAARARIAKLEADLLKIEGFRADLADRCFRKDLELDELRSTAWADD